MAIQVLMGYDGSPAANAAIDVCARLFPQAHARIVHLWTPPFANLDLRQRLLAFTANVTEFAEAIEREGAAEADRMAATGVTLARAAGWEPEPLVLRSYSGEGLRIAEFAEQVNADVVVVGSRGLGGARAVLGSFSDMVVHHSPRPVLVVPHPLLIADYAAVSGGPVLVGFDGSEGAQEALATATQLFPTRTVQPVAVDEGHADDVPSGARSGDAEVIRLPLPSGPRPHGRAVAAVLAACARDRSAAVLVVGSRGRSAVREILGSVAMATLHHSYRPVMVVPGTGRGHQ